MFAGLTGGSAFWEHYTESVLSKLTNGHARLNYLKSVKARYKWLLNNRYATDLKICRGCTFHFDGSNACSICAEYFCCDFDQPQCSLRRCSKCQTHCCLSDRSCDGNGNIVCIDCIDYHGNGDVSDNSDENMSIYSDSEQLSPSESEEEEEEGSFVE